MRHVDIKRWLILVAVATATVMIGLWSWNTLAMLFDLPIAQAHHALAALVLLSLIRGLLRPARRRWPRRSTNAGTSA